jgi:tripartite-type tricarboxylate transporter receptor subunit TctC
MTYSRRAFCKLIPAALAAPVVARPAFAGEWPKDRIIRTIVPFGAGSTIDIIGRIASDGISQRIGQTIIVENRSGAGGTIGSLFVARSEPDGYTMLINASNHTISPALYRNLAYGVADDFAGVAVIGTVSNILLVSPASGLKTAEDLVKKAKREHVTFSSSGVGSATHWAAERFRISAGFDATHVPFRAGPEALTEVMTGRVDFTCMGASSALPFIKVGKLTPLLVTSPRRAPALPDVMTSLEAGYKDSDYFYWNGLLVPAKTPRAIVDRLHREVTELVKTPEVLSKFDQQGIEVAYLTPAEFDAQLRKEAAENIRIAKDAGITLP